jgi:hypothetical protein
MYPNTPKGIQDAIHDNPDGFWEQSVDWSGRETVETAADSRSRVLRAVIDTATAEPGLFTDEQIGALRK